MLPDEHEFELTDALPCRGSVTRSLPSTCSARTRRHSAMGCVAPPQTSCSPVSRSNVTSRVRQSYH